MEKSKIEVYIDGSSVDVNAKKRPKGTEPVFPEWHGAYAGVFYVDGQEVLRMKGYEKGGTIGKMELSALVEAMRKLRKDGYEHIEIFSDSQYVVYGATKWYAGWMKKKFHGIKFPELWREMDILTLGCCFNISWIKGHHECPGNHVADKLANEALGAGITEWKVSGKERFLLFDKVERFETDTIIVNTTVPEGSVWDVNNNYFKGIHSGIIDNNFIPNEKQSDDNDFTDMAKKKPMEKSEEDEAEDYYQAIADYRNSHPVDYDKEISDCYESIQKGLERLKQLLIKKR